MTYIKVEGYDNLVRDEKTNAIINTNKSEYQKYLQLKEQRIKSDTRLNDIENDLNLLKNDISEIKQLLRNFLK